MVHGTKLATMKSYKLKYSSEEMKGKKIMPVCNVTFLLSIIGELEARVTYIYNV